MNKTNTNPRIKLSQYDTIYCFLFPVLCILAVPGHICTVLVICSFQHLRRKCMNIFIVNHSVLDIVLCVAVFFMQVRNVTNIVLILSYWLDEAIEPSRSCFSILMCVIRQHYGISKVHLKCLISKVALFYYVMRNMRYIFLFTRTITQIMLCK